MCRCKGGNPTKERIVATLDSCSSKCGSNELCKDACRKIFHTCIVRCQNELLACMQNCTDIGCLEKCVMQPQVRGRTSDLIILSC